MIGSDTRNQDRGASIIMLALSLFLLIGASAIAVDIAATWLDRSTDQKVTDSAAAAGSLEALTGGPRAACETALAYVAANTEDISSIDSSQCATRFSATCAVGREEWLRLEEGRYEITVTHPVKHDHELMTSGIVGAAPQALVPEDGPECSRVAVEMSATHRSLFAQVLGFSQGRTTVHTVATASTGFDSTSPINLLVLDRHRCNAIRAEGNGGIIVDAVFDPDAGGEGVPGLVQGILAADSNGSIGCGSEGVIHLQGSSSMIRADGPEGCANQSFPAPFGGTGTVAGFTKGFGCGRIETLAQGPPGCNLTSCSRTGGNEDYRPNPFPNRITKPKTRAPVDHRYNCKGDYSSTLPLNLDWATWALTTGNEQDIPPCDDPPAPHIDDLIREIRETGTPPGWTNVWAPGRSCAPSGTIEVSGDWYINCPNFSLGGGSTRITIRGNVVFDGSITMGSDSRLEIINTVADPGYVFLRRGVLAKAARANLKFEETMVYASKSARISLSGGDGSLDWVAPNAGRFEDLALWSDFVTPENSVCSSTTNCYNWAGQASLRMEGVFFMPFATADYSGSSGMNQTAAQWIADKLVARGSGVLTVAPDEGRQVLFPSDPGTVLIR